MVNLSPVLLSTFSIHFHPVQSMQRSHRRDRYNGWTCLWLLLLASAVFMTIGNAWSIIIIIRWDASHPHQSILLSSNKHINWNGVEKRFIIGHLHNTEVLCFPLSSRTCQYQELIKAGSSLGSNLSTVQVLNVRCHLLPCADLPSSWIYWNEIQEVKWRLCVWHTRNRWRSSFTPKHYSNRSRKDHLLPCPP